MALTANQIVRVRSSLHRAYSNEQLPTPWLKADADAAIGNADGWLDTSAAAFNVALPLPFRNTASASDKAVLLIAVAVAQRLIDEPERVDVLRAVLAELDGIQGA